MVSEEENHGSPVCEADEILSSDSDDENDDDRSSEFLVDDINRVTFSFQQIHNTTKTKTGKILSWHNLKKLPALKANGSAH